MPSAPGLPTKLFAGIPSGLVSPLLDSYQEISRNFRESRWEPAELNGGKLCEVVYTILRGHADGIFPKKPSKPKNMVDACNALANAPQSVSRSARIQIPRVLVALYEIRNNRGVGHVGGDVDANHMDAVLVLSMAKWVLSELIRIFHDLDTQTASDAVEALCDRTSPLVWQVAGKLRVLNPSLSMKEKSLALLYVSASPVSESTLFDWVEYSNAAMFRREILTKMHKQKLIEYDKTATTVHISPLGIRHVEEKITLEV
jgi:hypothetical protein